MPSDMTIIVADPARIPAIRDGMVLPGRMMYFTAGNAVSAFDTIRAHQPKLVVVDALFARTPPVSRSSSASNSWRSRKAISGWSFSSRDAG